MGVDEVVGSIQEYIVDDGSADYIGLHQGIETVSGITEILLGILVGLVVLFIQITVVFELLYINVPIVRAKIDEIDSNKKSSKAVNIMLRDGKKAVYLANTVETGTNVNGVYLRLKFKSLIVALILVCLCLGAWDIVVRFITNMIVTLFK